MKQLLLFSIDKNFHILLLKGKPIGAYSLRKYCITYVKNRTSLSWYNHKTNKLEYFTEGQAIKEKILIQKNAIIFYKNKVVAWKPIWMKQREYWNKYKKAIREGESVTQMYE